MPRFLVADAPTGHPPLGVPPAWALPAWATTDPALVACWGEVRARWGAAPPNARPDAAHDAAHLGRVAAWALRLLPDARADVGDPPGVADPERALPRLTLAAAVLHDVVAVPKADPARAAASTRSAAVARELLPPLGFPPAEVDVVADAVRTHSYSYCLTHGVAPASAVGRALQDADRLDALGALGVLRCAAAGAAGGAALVDPDDPWAAARPLDDRRFVVDHFQAKLLRLPPTLLTAGGRAEAARRAAVIVALLDALGDELGVPYTGLRVAPDTTGDS